MPKIIYFEKQSPYSKFLNVLLKIINKKQSFENHIKYYLKHNYLKKEFFEFSVPPQFLFKEKEYNCINFQNRNCYVFNSNKKNNSKRCILYLHGGAFLRNFYIFHWLFIKKILEYIHYPIYALDYPLIPYSNYKEILPFCLNFYINLRKEYNIILMGDSAGGNLCLSILKELSLKEYPEKIILLSPWLNLKLDNPLIEEIEKNDPILNKEGLILTAKIYCNNEDPINFSPLFYQYKKLPELHLFIGTNDILYPDCEDFFNKYNYIHFYEYKNMVHDWMILYLYPDPFLNFIEAEDVHNYLKKILSI